VIRSPWNLFRHRLLSISPSEVLLQTRGFRSTSEVVKIHLENVGRSFLEGYHATLQEPDIDCLCSLLDAIVPSYRGFAYEGAAMAAWLLDSLSVFRWNRWSELFSAVANKHPYVVHVGVGWALARLPWCRRNPERVLSRFDPLLRWLVIDGYGFHEGYFHASRWIRTPQRHPRLSEYARRAFDQGLGRSLWFVDGADVTHIAGAINMFDFDRRADLWSGVGLACAYAGQSTFPELEFLCGGAGDHLGHFRQGVTFGAEARVRGEIASEFTERTCTTVCQLDASSAAMLARTAMTAVERLAELKEPLHYEQWRARGSCPFCAHAEAHGR